MRFHFQNLLRVYFTAEESKKFNQPLTYKENILLKSPEAIWKNKNQTTQENKQTKCEEFQVIIRKLGAPEERHYLFPFE